MTGQGAVSRLTDFVLDTTEGIYDRLEEGANLLMGAWEDATAGSSSSSAGSGVGGDGGDRAGGPADGGHHEGDFEVGGEEEAGGDPLSSPLDGITDGVLGDILSSQTGPQTFREHVDAFRSAITWSEPFIVAIVGFHLLVLVVAVVAMHRRSLGGRMAIFAVAAAVVRGAESLNSHLRRNYEGYGITQNYFDEGGIFMGIVVCAPLLIVCIALLFSFLWEAKSLLVETKRMEFAAKRRRQQKKDDGAGKKSSDRTKDGAKNRKKGGAKEE